jgi:hypothetical protein
MLKFGYHISLPASSATEAPGKAEGSLVLLENVLQGQLQLAVVYRGVGDSLHDTGALGGIWGTELGMIESVEGFRSEKELVPSIAWLTNCGLPALQAAHSSNLPAKTVFRKNTLPRIGTRGYPGLSM